MSRVQETVARLRRRAPVGTLRVVDPDPLNWLSVTYNTVEELVRVTPDGAVRPAAMRSYRLVAPHPPGTHFNIDRRTTCEVVGTHRVRFHLPEPDGATLGKLRATHVMSERFWHDLGFGYDRAHSGEGHW